MLVRDLLRKLPPASAQLPVVPHTVNDVVWILTRGPYLREKCRCCAGSGMVVGKDDRPYVCGPCGAIPLYDKKHFTGSHFEHLAADDPRITAAHLALLG